MKRLTLRHLRCFVAVAETGSFTMAANRLFLTQSALTGTMQQFEEELGLRLFDRTTRRVELTEAAAQFKPVADRILRDFDTALEDLQAVAATKKGHLKIAAVPTAVAHILIPALKAFRQQYPGITFLIRDGSADKIERAVREGEVDFGLCGRSNGFPELAYQPLVIDRFGVIYLPGHPLAQTEGQVTWPDLDHHDYISLTNETDSGALLEAHPNLDLRRKSSENDAASSTSTLLAMLELGGKVAVVPALVAYGPLSNGYQFRILHEPAVNRELCLVTRPVRSLAPNTKRLIEFMIAALTDLPKFDGVEIVHPPEVGPVSRGSQA